MALVVMASLDIGKIHVYVVAACIVMAYLVIALLYMGKVHAFAHVYTRVPLTCPLTFSSCIPETWVQTHVGAHVYSKRPLPCLYDAHAYMHDQQSTQGSS